MILVVGATGNLGSEICRRLAIRGEVVRALVRHTADPAKLDAACTDVTAVISTATTTVSRQPGDSIEATDCNGQLNLVKAAKAADVPQFIFISYSGNLDSGDDPCPLAVAKRSVEQRLRKSGMTYTILRPSYFMEVWLSPVLGFDYPNAKATVYGRGYNKISYISLGDVAEFAVQSLDNSAARNAVIELGGPEALSPLEVVTIFEEVGGRRFEITHVASEALQAQKAAATDSLQKSFATLMLAQAIGNAIDMNGTLKTFPIKLVSVRDYAERVLQAEDARLAQEINT